MNGFAFTGELNADPVPAASQLEAIQASVQYLQSIQIPITLPCSAILVRKVDESNLIWYPSTGKLTLAYEVKFHPNDLDFWKIIVNANTLEVISAHSQRCALYPGHVHEAHLCHNEPMHEHDTPDHHAGAMLMDGPSSTTGTDLNGVNR